MKKTITIILFSIIAIVVTSCGPTKEEAISYNDKIINEQVAIFEKIDKVYEALKDYKNQTGMDYAYNEALKQVETGNEIVSKTDKFDGNSELRDGALKLFATYKSVLQNEIKRMIEIIKLPDNLYTTDMEAEFNKLSDASLKTLNQSEKEFIELQKTFATKYKFEIEKIKPR
jgi:hypothetical protein